MEIREGAKEMTITTEDAARLAGGCDIDGFTERAAAFRSLAAERDALTVEVKRLKAGGCARDQSITQFCAEVSERDAEIEKLRAALKTARRDALEEAARWHDEQRKSNERGLEYSSLVGIPVSNAADLRSSAKTHEWCAAAIRALKGEGDD